ncbi:class GN sortase [Aestuariirhabdus sp. LZHN29]|uniref:class GN sortase n=1 Tax=Aestuariirhabdus sp. LZHN29 TaxID=3417462 RepID=UPI003CFB4587
MRLTHKIAALLLLLAGLLMLAQGSYIQVKALVAQYLLQSAWQRSLHQGLPVKPWPWADGHPIARLQIPRIELDQLVLDGASGRNLAFAPSHLIASSAPNSGGTTILSAHRDTHFSRLQELIPGDTLILQSTGASRRYRVDSTHIADSRTQQLSLDAGDRLLLVTCYPFKALRAGGPLRYVVSASPLPQLATAGNPSPKQWLF